MIDEPSKAEIRDVLQKFDEFERAMQRIVDMGKGSDAFLLKVIAASMASPISTLRVCREYLEEVV